MFHKAVTAAKRVEGVWRKAAYRIHGVVGGNRGTAFPESRPVQTGALLARGAAAVLEAAGFACLVEFPLGNGRRVDLIGLDEQGRVAIVEVKSSLADYRADGKWMDYLPYCDLFFFAVPEDFPLVVLDEPEAARERIGIMVVDRHAGVIRRRPRLHPLHPSRRKALTLRFARAAARRLKSGSAAM
ncbi:MAG: DNA repair protein MmcB-related protein [Alphaproteobacteria bacterium]|nr:MAG: DNA repair protein MmcB-related protein [Alphaproteobacteria bacterium]